MAVADRPVRELPFTDNRLQRVQHPGVYPDVPLAPWAADHGMGIVPDGLFDGKNLDREPRMRR